MNVKHVFREHNKVLDILVKIVVNEDFEGPPAPTPHQKTATLVNVVWGDCVG